MIETAHSSDRRITILLLLAGATIAIVGIGTFLTITNANTTNDIRNGNEVSGCRSQFAALVTDARSDLDQANALLNLLTNKGLETAVKNDAAATAAVVAALPDARADVVKAVDRIGSANDRYQTAVELSISDPVAFLAQCKESP